MYNSLADQVLIFIDDLINNKQNTDDLILINDLAFYLYDLIELKKLKDTKDDDLAYDLELDIAKSYSGRDFMSLVTRYNKLDCYNNLCRLIMDKGGNDEDYRNY